jgi:hypothetical protein
VEPHRPTQGTVIGITHTTADSLAQAAVAEDVVSTAGDVGDEDGWVSGTVWLLQGR